MADASIADILAGLGGTPTAPSVTSPAAANQPSAVNTSQAANGSGDLFNQFIGGLSSLTTAAANGYNAVEGKPASTVTTPAPASAVSALGSIPVYVWIIGAALIGWLLLRKK